jgi:hypothetical protein
MGISVYAVKTGNEGTRERGNQVSGISDQKTKGELLSSPFVLGIAACIENWEGTEPKNRDS